MSRSTVHPDKLLKELADLWVSLGREKEGVLRACTMTLIVLAEETEDPQKIGETLAALMADHPSRAILVRLHSSPEREMSARVYSQCWRPFGQRQQICCEQIEITASDAGLADLRPVIVAIAAPDLPVVLWCRSGRMFRHRDFPLLAGIAGKVIVDGAQLGRPAEALSLLVGAPYAIADLAWTRLTRWRQLISGIFDQRDYAVRLAGVRQITIRFAGDEPPLEAIYLGVWLKQGLAAAGADAEVRYERNPQAAAGSRQIAIECPDLSLSLALSGSAAAEARLDELVSKSACPDQAEHALLREELSIQSRDLVFERVLAESTQVAVSS